MQRRVTTTVAGAVLVLCAVPAAAVLFLAPEPYWSSVLWLGVLGLIGGGLTVALFPGLRRPTAAAVTVCAAHLAGHGTVGIRDVFNAAGADAITPTQTEMADWVAQSAILALVGTVATCVALALLWREPRRGWQAWRPLRARLLVGGLAVMAVSIGLGALEALTMAGELLLKFGLPFGGGLVMAAWLGKRARRAATTAVGVSFLVAAASVGGYVVRQLLET
ncbi:hypothetical protein [Actinoplanes rectilineatus]|uniref:hypothetical protein n=1 Tax=Actinoplanes rectilineatus TaxID=113571 RepID=UPI0005F2A283|nr:hypothetical protein [Actinoplanes rectilineatus]